MENIETCSICHEEFKEPCHLPCNHIFCRNCITESLEVSIVKNIIFFLFSRIFKVVRFAVEFVVIC